MSDDRASGRPDPMLDKNDEGEAVRRIQAYLDQLRQRGEPLPTDRAEWDRFFQLHAPFFRRLVRNHHWPTADCEDVVQGLWLLLITELPALRYDVCRGHLESWISTVARRWLIDQDRYRRSRLVQHLGNTAAGHLTGRELDPAATIEREQLIASIREALAELRLYVPARDYEAFTLHRLEGLSVREVADRLSLTEAKIWASDHRLLQKLRVLLVRRLDPRPSSD